MVAQMWREARRDSTGVPLRDAFFFCESVYSTHMSVKTLVFLHKPETQEILLAMKKRGFGAGKWNGTGGKVEPGESIKEAAVRETREEVCVSVDPHDLRLCAVLHFSFEDKPELSQSVHVFFATRWQGEPKESEEMRPQWYRYDAIPYEVMWIDDQHWLLRVLGGERIEATFHFASEGDAILDMEARPLSVVP